MQRYTDEDIAKFRQAGKITAQARDYGVSLIKPGASLLEVSEAVEDKIRSLGGLPAFPAQISLNNTAAHYCASPEDPYCFQEGDVAKLDVGAHVDGYVGDSAATVTLSLSNMLAEASKLALTNAIQAIEPNGPISEASQAIKSAITGMGFRPVSNLSGHAVGIYKIHGNPQVPNVPERRKDRFEKGLVIAIEPFASTGKGFVREQGRAEIFSVIGRIKLKKGMDENVVRAIEAFKGLPFARRNLTSQFPKKEVMQTLNLMLKKKMLYGYPPLREEAGVLISQAEHTVYIGDKVEILTISE